MNLSYNSIGLYNMEMLIKYKNQRGMVRKFILMKSFKH